MMKPYSNSRLLSKTFQAFAVGFLLIPVALLFGIISHSLLNFSELTAVSTVPGVVLRALEVAQLALQQAFPIMIFFAVLFAGVTYLSE